MDLDFFFGEDLLLSPESSLSLLTLDVDLPAGVLLDLTSSSSLLLLLLSSSSLSELSYLLLFPLEEAESFLLLFCSSSDGWRALLELKEEDCFLEQEAEKLGRIFTVLSSLSSSEDVYASSSSPWRRRPSPPALPFPSVAPFSGLRPPPDLFIPLLLPLAFPLALLPILLPLPLLAPPHLSVPPLPLMLSFPAPSCLTSSTPSSPSIWTWTSSSCSCRQTCSCYGASCCRGPLTWTCCGTCSSSCGGCGTRIWSCSFGRRPCLLNRKNSVDWSGTASCFAQSPGSYLGTGCCFWGFNWKIAIM